MFFNAVGLLNVYDEMSVMQVVKLTRMTDICSSLKQIVPGYVCNPGSPRERDAASER